MKILNYTSIPPTRINNDQAQEVSGRVAVGKNDGANNFCMRIFEIASGGYTPKHAHDWEHEIFFHSGEGEVYGNGQWNTVKPGTVIFVPPKEEHQIRNTGKWLLVFACLIPSGIPEL